jgi:uncharacterized membrane protein
MNAFSLYLILQLDSIGTTLAIVSIVGALASVIGLIVAGCQRGDENWRAGGVDHTVSNAIFKYAKRGLITCVALFAFNGLLPSSKTAAVMIVLPAVANNENIQREAGELYQIAKQGLADLVKKAVTPKEEPAKESPK